MEACYSGLRMTLEESMARLWEGKHCLLDGQCIFGRQSLGLTVDARQRGVLYISQKMLLETPWRRILRSDGLPDLKGAA